MNKISLQRKRMSMSRFCFFALLLLLFANPAISGECSMSPLPGVSIQKANASFYMYSSEKIVSEEDPNSFVILTFACKENNGSVDKVKFGMTFTSTGSEKIVPVRAVLRSSTSGINGDLEGEGGALGEGEYFMADVGESTDMKVVGMMNSSSWELDIVGKRKHMLRNFSRTKSVKNLRDMSIIAMQKKINRNQ